LDHLSRKRSKPHVSKRRLAPSQQAWSRHLEVESQSCTGFRATRKTQTLVRPLLWELRNTSFDPSELQNTLFLLGFW
jgi:hypothetical protein